MALGGLTLCIPRSGWAYAFHLGAQRYALRFPERQLAYMIHAGLVRPYQSDGLTTTFAIAEAGITALNRNRERRPVRMLPEQGTLKGTLPCAHT